MLLLTALNGPHPPSPSVSPELDCGRIRPFPRGNNVWEREPPRPGDPLQILENAPDEETYLTNVKARLARIQETVEAAREKHRQADNSLRNAKRVQRVFEEGDLIYILQNIISGNSGLLCKKRGPYIVEEVSTHAQTAICRELSTNKEVKCHFNHMQHSNQARLNPRLNSEWDQPLRQFNLPRIDPG